MFCFICNSSVVLFLSLFLACFDLSVFESKAIQYTVVLFCHSGITTAAPPDIVIPNEALPDNIGGGGFIQGASIGGIDEPSVSVIGIGGPGPGVEVSGVGIDVDAVPMAYAAMVGPSSPASGARAGAVVGTVLGKKKKKKK